MSCHEMQENGRNEGVGGAAYSCRELPGNGKNGGREGLAGG